jgi:hypothetical protein
MTLAQGSAVIALVSAVVAVVVTTLGIFERRRAFQAQQAELNRQAERWNAEFLAERNRQEVPLRGEFLLEQYRYRVPAYRDVFKTLGAVPDVMLESGPDKYKEPDERLGSDKQPTVRLAWVYTMAGVADDWPESDRRAWLCNRRQR